MVCEGWWYESTFAFFTLCFRYLVRQLVAFILPGFVSRAVRDRPYNALCKGCITVERWSLLLNLSSRYLMTCFVLRLVHGSAFFVDGWFVEFCVFNSGSVFGGTFFHRFTHNFVGQFVSRL